MFFHLCNGESTFFSDLIHAIFKYEKMYDYLFDRTRLSFSHFWDNGDLCITLVVIQSKKKH